jgi:hypothetical protein
MEWSNTFHPINLLYWKTLQVARLEETFNVAALMHFPLLIQKPEAQAPIADFL